MTDAEKLNQKHRQMAMDEKEMRENLTILTKWIAWWMNEKEYDKDRGPLSVDEMNGDPVKVRTLEAARCIPKLKGFDLKEEFFEAVCHPEDRVKGIAGYVEGGTCEANVWVADIKGTTHPSYCGLNWLQMLMSLDRHKDDYDEESVRRAIGDTGFFERIHLRRYGDLYFIDGGGNHRVCQAKFLGMETVPCEVTEYVLKG